MIENSGWGAWNADVCARRMYKQGMSDHALDYWLSGEDARTIGWRFGLTYSEVRRCLLYGKGGVTLPDIEARESAANPPIIIKGARRKSADLSLLRSPGVLCGACGLPLHNPAPLQLCCGPACTRAFESRATAPKRERAKAAAALRVQPPTEDERRQQAKDQARRYAMLMDRINRQLLGRGVQRYSRRELGDG